MYLGPFQHRQVQLLAMSRPEPRILDVGDQLVMLVM